MLVSLTFQAVIYYKNWPQAGPDCQRLSRLPVSPHTGMDHLLPSGHREHRTPQPNCTPQRTTLPTYCTAELVVGPLRRDVTVASARRL